CTTYDDAGHSLPLDESARADALAVAHGLAERGMRVLAVASHVVPPHDAYERGDETALVLRGFLAFEDPPLADAGRAVATLAADGVTVKIITGDDPAVARHVCAQCAMPEPRIVVGTE